MVKQTIDKYEKCSDPNQKYELIRGKIATIASDQSGSRFLQKLLMKAPIAQISDILSEIAPIFWELMMDKYANYFCQRLFSTSASE